MAKESKYATKLRELGFRRIEELHSKEDIEEVDKSLEKRFGHPMPHKLSRADRRRLVAAGHFPNFTRIDGDTYAFDDRGREWWALGQLIDLKPFGFSDNVEFFVKRAQEQKSKLN